MVGDTVSLNVEHYYIHNNTGGVTFGIARRAATDFLRSFGNLEDFLGPQ